MASPALQQLMERLEGQEGIYLFQAITVLFFLLILYQLWQGLALLELPAPSDDSIAIHIPTPAPIATRLSSLSNLHLFGSFDQINPNALPESGLDLKLRGTFVANLPSASFAVIADSSGRQKLYKAGDSLPGGITIKQILVDRVVLDDGGHLETLVLPKFHLPFSPPPKALNFQEDSAN